MGPVVTRRRLSHRLLTAVQPSELCRRNDVVWVTLVGQRRTPFVTQDQPLYGLMQFERPSRPVSVGNALFRDLNVLTKRQEATNLLRLARPAS